tara:strand:+ start:335 stop:604 length:270 start_codon:yes stop_codon:yes gene_type:complete
MADNKDLKWFMDQRDKLMSDHLEAYFAAPSKSSYNRVTGQYAQTKSNISRATKANLRELNSFCEAQTGKTIWESPDEKPVDIGTPVDPE